MACEGLLVEAGVEAAPMLSGSSSRRWTSRTTASAASATRRTFVTNGRANPTERGAAVCVQNHEDRAER